MTDQQPLLSIVIVAYKSATDLQRCLPSLYTAELAQITHEVLIIDNYGEDQLETWLAATYPASKYFLNPLNTGYSGGNNIGIDLARGHWTLLLNPDTELLPGSLAQLLETAKANPDALINPKLLNPDGTINACGNQMHYTGITTCRGLNEPSGNYQKLERISLLSGAAVLSPTAVLRTLLGFDEQYFMYFEDTDLSLRARLLGYPLLCESRSVIIHHYRLGMNSTKFGYLERNRLLTLLKVLSGHTLRQLLPALLITEFLTWVYALRGRSYLRSRFWGYTWLWQNRQEIREKRRQIQQTRLIPDAELIGDSLSALPFDQVVSSPIGKFINWLTYQVYRLLRPYFLRPSSYV
ncbi:glycosyltransferase family 2 protein [Fibrella sp. USSR17]|nr:glycosyl transferase family 2 [Fibrella sp. ES10-3-2-2]